MQFSSPVNDLRKVDVAVFGLPNRAGGPAPPDHRMATSLGSIAFGGLTPADRSALPIRNRLTVRRVSSDGFLIRPVLKPSCVFPDFVK